MQYSSYPYTCTMNHLIWYMYIQQKKKPSLNSHSYYWHKEKLAYVQFYESLIDLLDSK